MTTIEECLLWAKDRLADDIRFGLLAGHYLGMSIGEQENFNKACGKFGRLMELPVALESLDEMKAAGYWNGREDTYFEEHPLPLWLR